MIRRKKSLLWKLFQSHLLIAVLSLATVLLFTVLSLREFHDDRTNSELQTRAQLFSELLPDDISIDSANRVNALVDSIAVLIDTRLTVVLPDGMVIADSDENWRIMQNHGDRPELIEAFAGHNGISKRYSSTLQLELMYVAIPLFRNGEMVAAVRASMPVTRVGSSLRGVLVNIILITVIICIFITGVSYIISSKISWPIRQISELSRRYSHGDFKQRMPSASTREIADLAESLTEAANDIDALLRSVNDRRRKLEAVLSGMSEALFSVDKDGRIVEINQAAEKLIHRSRDAVQGRRIQEVMRDVQLHRFVEQTLSSLKLIEDEIVLHDDNERILQAHGTRIDDDTSSNIGAVIVLNDITSLKRLESMRRDFVANVSHELKTPITSILGFVETLRDGAIDDSDNRQQFLDIIHRHVIRLNSIIDDLLSLSRVEQTTNAGIGELEKVNICDLLLSAQSICKSKAEEKKISLDIICQRIDYHCNRSLMEQALINLVDNAVKYCPEGTRIMLAAEKNDSEILITVTDNGPGIAQDQQSRIFERFYRIDRGRSRALGGTGLGLAIVKHIAIAHGGSVTLESAIGKGSAFTIHLPPAMYE